MRNHVPGDGIFWLLALVRRNNRRFNYIKSTRWWLVRHFVYSWIDTLELPDGSKTFGKTINNNPEKYFTQEILDKLDEVCAKEFKYGDVIDTEDTIETPDNES
mgnify:CR=1 FL=1